MDLGLATGAHITCSVVKGIDEVGLQVCDDAVSCFILHAGPSGGA